MDHCKLQKAELICVNNFIDKTGKFLYTQANYGFSDMNRPIKISSHDVYIYQIFYFLQKHMMVVKKMLLLHSGLVCTPFSLLAYYGSESRHNYVMSIVRP